MLVVPRLAWPSWRWITFSHADLAPPTTLATAHEHRAALRIKVVLAQRERLLDAKPAAPEHHDYGAQPEAVRVLAGVAHHADDLLNGRRIGRVEHALVAGRTP
jgi:hypothetical protein